LDGTVCNVAQTPSLFSELMLISSDEHVFIEFLVPLFDEVSEKLVASR
jgi:hypothetical protein